MLYLRRWPSDERKKRKLERVARNFVTRLVDYRFIRRETQKMSNETRSFYAPNFDCITVGKVIFSYHILFVEIIKILST